MSHPSEKRYPIKRGIAGVSWDDECEAIHDATENTVHVRPRRAARAQTIDRLFAAVEPAASRPTVQIMEHANFSTAFLLGTSEQLESMRAVIVYALRKAGFEDQAELKELLALVLEDLAPSHPLYDRVTAALKRERTG